MSSINETYLWKPIDGNLTYSIANGGFHRYVSLPGCFITGHSGPAGWIERMIRSSVAGPIGFSMALAAIGQKLWNHDDQGITIHKSKL